MFGAPQLRKKSNFGLNMISFLKDQQSSGNRLKTEPVGWSRCPIWTLHHFTGQMRTRGRCRQCLDEDPLLSQWRWPNVVPKVFRENWILVLLSSSFNSVCVDRLCICEVLASFSDIIWSGCYRRQRSYGKVIFSEVFVCPQGEADHPSWGRPSPPPLEADRLWKEHGTKPDRKWRHTSPRNSMEPEKKWHHIPGNYQNERHASYWNVFLLFWKITDLCWGLIHIHRPNKVQF